MTKELAWNRYAPALDHGRALVLLHGFPFDHRMWSDVVSEYLRLPEAATWPIGILAPDLPGLGASPIPKGADPAITTSAAMVADGLRKIGVQSAVVAGMSMGGYVAIELARSEPEFVAGLALIDTRSGADGPAAGESRSRMVERLETEQTIDAARGIEKSQLSAVTQRDRPDVGGRLDAMVRDQRPAGIAWSQRAMASRRDGADVLRRFGRPAVVIVGEEDSLTGPDVAAEMAGMLSDAELVVVPDAGHQAVMEDPRRVAVALSALVDRAWPGSR